MQVSRVLAFADDLTGAIEIGAKFADCGLPARVALWPSVKTHSNEPFEVLVIDTESRHLLAEAAGDRIRYLIENLHGPNIELLYQKTDSTLRGNVAAELNAIADSLLDRTIVYAPAYPAFGRTVQDGLLYIDGIPLQETEFASDLLNPVRSNDIRGLVGANARIEIHDGEVEADLAAVAERILRQTSRPIACGPAALAGHLAERLGQKRDSSLSLPNLARCLIINGSVHPRSLQQIRNGEMAGWVTIPAQNAATAFAEPRWAILECSEEFLQNGARRESEPFGGVERTLCALEIYALQLDALVVFGGDTAFHVVTALGLSALDPLGEVLPGIPISRIEGPTSGPRYLITKAGGFGPPDALERLRSLLTAGH